MAVAGTTFTGQSCDMASSTSSESMPALSQRAEMSMSSRQAPGSIEFTDVDGRHVLFSLYGSGAIHYSVNGRIKVSKVSKLHAVDRTLHVEGKKLLATSCAATVPEELNDGRMAMEVINSIMDLFSRRASQDCDAWRLVVSIISADGLKSADRVPLGPGSSDPYCICEVVGRPETRTSTDMVRRAHNPMWLHMCVLEGWRLGDSLLFTIWDRDRFKFDDRLGWAELPTKGARPPCFDGNLVLRGAGRGVEARITVRVRAAPRPTNAEGGYAARRRCSRMC